MSFEYNGTTFTGQTTLEHAQNALDYINAIRSTNGQSQIVPTIANAIWLMELSNGNLASDYDFKLEQAANSWDVSLADATQIVSMLPMVGTKLISATYSTVSLSVTAAATGSAVILSGAVCPFTSTINFLVNSPITVPAGTTVTGIIATCDTAGPVAVGVGNITSITGVSNIQTVTNPSVALLGSNAESAEEVRSRIIAGKTIEYNADGVARAILSLTGIQNAVVWFNSDNSAVLTLTGGITVQPRHARIIISGSSSEIAKTYYDRMTAPTDGAQTQLYTTLAGQNISINYDNATTQDVYINVYYSNTSPTQSGFDTQIKDLVLSLNANFTIGQTITAELVSAILVNFPYATINGVEISDDDITYTRSVTCNANAIPTILVANINVIGE